MLFGKPAQISSKRTRWLQTVREVVRAFVVQRHVSLAQREGSGGLIDNDQRAELLSSFTSLCSEDFLSANLKTAQAHIDLVAQTMCWPLSPLAAEQNKPVSRSESAPDTRQVVEPPHPSTREVEVLPTSSRRPPCQSGPAGFTICL